MPKRTSYHDLKQYDDVLEVLPVVAAAIEEGEVYRAHLRTPEMAENAEVEMFIRTPSSSVHCHVIAQFSAELAAQASLRESCTVSASGSLLTPYNVNRNKGDSSTVSVRSSPTLTGSGTRLDIFDFGGGKKGETGGDAQSQVGWIARYGTVYILRIRSCAGANNGSIRLTIREHAE